MQETYNEGSRTSSDRGWEVAVSEVTSNGVQEVQVESGVVALAERCLHGDLISIRCP